MPTCVQGCKRKYVLQVLSLQLLKILLENIGTVFRNSERFQGAIKQHLCLSLLKNVTVPSAQVTLQSASDCRICQYCSRLHNLCKWRPCGCIG